jgi:hypothetical protein
MLKTFVIAVAQVFMAGAALATVLVLLGHGPWNRWLMPLLLVAAGYGIVTLLRRRRTSTAAPLALPGD